MRTTVLPAVFFTALAGLVACAGERPEGLRQTPEGTGPKIVWNVDAKPIPEIPLPNDYAMHVDSTSPTGLRVNLSQEAKTEVEARLRRRAARLDGFGTWAPIVVKFEAPIELSDIVRRQRENDDFADDAVYVIDITPGSKSFRQAQRLDFGHGYFPGALPDVHFYYDHDPRDGQSNILYETVDEDLNKNGRLDPGEDTDGDDVLDQPNVYPKGGNMWDHLLTWYERETNTLLLRPIQPLREQTRYAVVLTSRLKGENGQSVRSPFDYTTLASQTEDLTELPAALKAYGLTIDDVAFAWTFTTQSVTLDLRTVRAGLYGHGSLSRLDGEFAESLTLAPVRTKAEPGKPLHVLYGDDITPFASFMGPAMGLGPETVSSLLESFSFVSHVVFGSFKAPDFLVDKDGLATADNPQNDDDAWDLDPVTGKATYAKADVTFVCVIPKARPGVAQPYPVVLHTTGTGAPKLSALAYGGFHAKQGLATCAIDPYGQGLPLQKSGLLTAETIQPILDQLGFGPFLPALTGNRVRDLDNDGVGDSGGDFWSPDPFHSRDTIRQTVVDWLQFVRILRSFDGKARGIEDLNGDGQLEALGDWDQNGVPDIGTEAGVYTAWGISLGGMVTGVFAGIEPKLAAAVPQSGGGGLIDVAMRSTQAGVPEMVIMGSWGPIIHGNPIEKGAKTEIQFMIPHFVKVEQPTLATVPGLVQGDLVIATNLRTGESGKGMVQKDHGFRLSVPADAKSPTELRAQFKLRPDLPLFEPHRLKDTLTVGDPLEIVIVSADGKEKARIRQFDQDVTWAGCTWSKGQPLVAMTKGLGRPRQTPAFRQLAVIAQTIVEPADPVNWARHYFQEPLTFDYDKGAEPGCNILDLPTIGDTNVPIATGIALARAAGILAPDQSLRLIENKVAEGLWRLGRYRKDGSGPHAFDPAFDTYKNADHRADAILFDIDWVSQGQDGTGAPHPGTPLRATVDSLKGGKSGMRIAYTEVHGSHGIRPPCKPVPNEPAKCRGIDYYGVNLMTRFMVTGGTELPVTDAENGCLWFGTCDYILQTAPK